MALWAAHPPSHLQCPQERAPDTSPVKPRLARQGYIEVFFATTWWAQVLRTVLCTRELEEVFPRLSGAIRVRERLLVLACMPSFLFVLEQRRNRWQVSLITFRSTPTLVVESPLNTP